MKHLARSIRFVHLPALAAVVLFLWLVVRFWNPVFGFTAFIQLDQAHATSAIDAFHEYPIFIHPGVQPYDGMQYSQIAYHPLLDSRELSQAVDSPAYRARRILMPVVSWLLAAGRPALIAHVYASLNILCWLILAYLLWRRLPVTDARGALAWIGLLFSAGALGSVRFALIDIPALLLTAVAVWAVERGRWRSFAGWLAAAVLTRETAILASLACCDPRRRSPRDLARCLLCVFVVSAPLLVWLAYVHWRLDGGAAGARNFSWPFAGLLEKWVYTVRATWDLRGHPQAWRTLLSTAAVSAQAAFIVVWRRPSDPWWRLGASFTVLLLCLGPAAWEGDPGASTRVLLPLNLACNLLAVRVQAPLRWLLMCNLTVFSGISSLHGLPPYPEMAARRGLAAATAEATMGWYDRESDSHHAWRWSRYRGAITIRTWPRSAAVDVRLTLKLQGMTSRRVWALSGGNLLWTGDVTREGSSAELPLTIRGGEAIVSFGADRAPVFEPRRPDARLLGFAIVDPKLTVVGWSQVAR